LIGEMLKETCDVVSAANAEEALQVLSENFGERPPDLLLLDIRLPGGRSGAELPRPVRDFRPTKEVPAVALTTYARPEQRKALLEEGFDEYVSKLFRREELFGAIDRVLSSRIFSGESLSQGN
jgi:CheY-like chemotaxis protein